MKAEAESKREIFN